MILYKHKMVRELTKMIIYSSSASKISFIQILICNKGILVGEEGAMVELGENDMGASSNRMKLKKMLGIVKRHGSIY